MDKNYKLHQDFCEFLIKEIADSMSGAGEDLCLYNMPSNKYCVGSLAARHITPEDLEENEEMEDDFLAKYAPNSIGIGFLTDRDLDTNLLINIGFNVYYRVLPSYEIQMGLKEQRRRPAVVYRKKTIPSNEARVVVKVTDIPDDGKLVLRMDQMPNLKSVLDRIRDEIAQDENTFPDDEYLGCVMDGKDLRNKEAFDEHIRSLKSKPKIVPEWEVELRLEKKNDLSGNCFYQVMLINCRNKDFKVFSEEYIFDVRIIVSLEKGNIKPFEFNMLEESYRYKRDMWGLGINCSVKRKNDSTIETQNVPIYRQLRYGTRKKLPDGEELINAAFADLTQKPLPILEKVEEQMRKYLDYCKQNPDRFIDRYTKNRDSDLLEFNKSLQAFEMEISRYSQGLELLKKSNIKNSPYGMIYQSFILMSKTFGFMNEKLGKNIKSWRLFQIVFIVSNLFDIAAQHWTNDPYFKTNNIEKVSILWFPTGGGKTEAYLGLSIFNMFFDRLRGKDAGLTVLLRFPLRILTLQQFQRIFNVIMFANSVKETYKIPGQPFSLGYWAGDNQTPNRVRTFVSDEWKEVIERVQENKPTKEDLDKLLKVNICPLCNSEVKVVWNKKLETIVHICSDNNCSWTKNKGYLPIFISDEDLYQRIPTAIISTVDKVAVLGMQTNFMNLFGGARFYSEKKGFSWRSINDDPEAKELDIEYRRLLRPTIQIQDELHLMKEDLGAYDSHYETTILELQKEISGNYAWKLIASTATIRESNRHVAHLYGKIENQAPAIRFPVEGPNCEETFYSVAEDEESVGRFYLGIVGHNKTHINTIVDVIYNFHKITKSLRDLSVTEFIGKTGLDVKSDKEIKELLDDYEIGLNYVLTKRNADQIAESIDSQIKEYLIFDNITEVNNKMLTGGTTQDELTSILRAIEKPSNNQTERITSLTATSMISHGVDIDRLNFMTFFGLPRQTAEYIQASSRVGRKWPGITIDVLAPQKERDRSYYQFFEKYHEYLERLVEAPAINRWAKYSINKTLPGILCGYFLNMESRNSNRYLYYAREASDYINSMPRDVLNDVKRRTKEIIDEFYVIDTYSGDHFKNVIELMVDSLIETLKYNRTKEGKLSDIMESESGYGPMKSLRDTEEEAPFYPSDELSKRYLGKVKFFKE